MQSPAGSQNPEGGPYVASNRWAAALPRALALGFFGKAGSGVLCMLAMGFFSTGIGVS